VSDLVHAFSEIVRDAEGRAYMASVHAAERTDGLWEAWIEFQGLGQDVTLRTGRETEQSDRHAVTYWAAGLQPSYLDGALVRAFRARLAQLRTLLEGRAAS
jgi:hypothetical protein